MSAGPDPELSELLRKTGKRVKVKPETDFLYFFEKEGLRPVGSLAPAVTLGHQKGKFAQAGALLNATGSN